MVTAAGTLTLENLLYEKKDGIAYVTLNRPKVLNAVSPQLSDSIDRILNWAEQEGEIW